MGWGGTERVGPTVFQKQNQGLWIEWICGRGLGTCSGHGEVWIGVPVQCYMECNTVFILSLISEDICCTRQVFVFILGHFKLRISIVPAGHYPLLTHIFWVIYHCGFISSVALTGVLESVTSKSHNWENQIYVSYLVTKKNLYVFLYWVTVFLQFFWFYLMPKKTFWLLHHQYVLLLAYASI